MKFTYDKDADAAYLQLSQVKDDRGIVKKTVPVTDDINIDYDAQDRMFGIEFLNASDLLPAALLSEDAARRKKSA